eukprot:Lankesteria_metandrocarpae@DN1320_c0_g1_i1.p1
MVTPPNTTLSPADFVVWDELENSTCINFCCLCRNDIPGQNARLLIVRGRTVEICEWTHSTEGPFAVVQHDIPFPQSDMLLQSDHMSNGQRRLIVLKTQRLGVAPVAVQSVTLCPSSKQLHFIFVFSNFELRIAHYDEDINALRSVCISSFAQCGPFTNSSLFTNSTIIDRSFIPRCTIWQPPSPANSDPCDTLQQLHTVACSSLERRVGSTADSARVPITSTLTHSLQTLRACCMDKPHKGNLSFSPAVDKRVAAVVAVQFTAQHIVVVPIEVHNTMYDDCDCCASCTVPTECSGVQQPVLVSGRCGCCLTKKKERADDYLWRTCCEGNSFGIHKGVVGVCSANCPSDVHIGNCFHVSVCEDLCLRVDAVTSIAFAADEVLPVLGLLCNGVESSMTRSSTVIPASNTAPSTALYVESTSPRNVNIEECTGPVQGVTTNRRPPTLLSLMLHIQSADFHVQSESGPLLEDTFTILPLPSPKRIPQTAETFQSMSRGWLALSPMAVQQVLPIPTVHRAGSSSSVAKGVMYVQIVNQSALHPQSSVLKYAVENLDVEDYSEDSTALSGGARKGLRTKLSVAANSHQCILLDGAVYSYLVDSDLLLVAPTNALTGVIEHKRNFKIAKLDFGPSSSSTRLHDIQWESVPVSTTHLSESQLGFKDVWPEHPNYMWPTMHILPFAYRSSKCKGSAVGSAQRCPANADAGSIPTVAGAAAVNAVTSLPSDCEVVAGGDVLSRYVEYSLYCSGDATQGVPPGVMALSFKENVFTNIAAATATTAPTTTATTAPTTTATTAPTTTATTAPTTTATTAPT